MTSNAQAVLIAPRLAEADPPPVVEGRTATDGRAAGFPEWHIEIHCDAAALARLGPDWDALFAKGGRASQVFQTHAFAELFVQTFGYGQALAAGQRDCPCGLAIVTARRNGRLVLVWPLVESRQLGMRVLGWLGEPIAQYGDVLIDPDEAALPLLSAAFRHIEATRKPDLLRLRRVRSDAAIATFLAERGIAPSNLVEAPSVTLAAGGSAFEDRQSGKARKNRRRLMRRLEERGEVAFKEISPADDTATLVAAGLADKREWLKRRGLLSPALADNRVDRFMKAAAADPRRPTGCALFRLSLDDRPIAVAMGFRCKQRLMLHLITYAADVEKNGAGVLNLEAILRLAEAEELTAVDLLPPKADYKLDWSDQSITVADRIWGVTARGKLWGMLLDGVVRPQAKRMFERLPLGPRRHLAARSLAPGRV